MSWPDRRFVLLAPLALAACGFEPVYGPGGTGRLLQNNVLVDAPGTQNAYLLTRELEERLGRATAPAYALSLDIRTFERPLAIDRAGNTGRFQMQGHVSYALRRSDTGQIITSGQVENFAGYSATGTTVATLAGEDDARERLMNMLAEQIATRLYAAELPA